MMIDIDQLTEDHGRMVAVAVAEPGARYRCDVCGREVHIGPGATYRQITQGNPLARHTAGAVAAARVDVGSAPLPGETRLTDEWEAWLR